MFLEFEKQIAELEGKIEELRHLSDDGDINIAAEISRLQKKANQQLKTTYKKLSPWQKVQVARHPNRPHFKDVSKSLLSDFIPLSGDRYFGEDKAVVAGIGKFKGQSVVIIGTEKGDSTEERIESNFGMARPEGYRKAQRLMDIANRFNLPVLTFIDTAGAYPGVGAEERGQAEAIARTIEKSLTISVPLIAVILGEGGSGGAVALATANQVLMLEHAIYSVISPEGCASILWRSSNHAVEAANALKLTAQDLYSLRIIDNIIEEPLGAAHRDHSVTIDNLEKAIATSLATLCSQNRDQLVNNRRKKFLDMHAGKLI